jgi:hypothetical protein
MSKNWNFALFLAIFAVALLGLPQIASAQNKPAPEVKEKAGNCDHDDDDDEDITEADRASVKISIKDAKLIALGRIPGKIMDAEFEKEHGRLQYAFDILGDDGKTYDVEIDAITGEVLQAKLDDDDDEDGPAAKTVVKTKTVKRIVKVERTATVVKKP